MDKKKRILSRKVAFVYLYQKYFTWYLSNKDIIFEEILKVDKIVNWHPITEEARKSIKNSFASFYDISNFEEDVDYIIKNFFWQKDVEFEYVKNVVQSYDDYKNKVEKEVDEYTKTFDYKDMDLVDRVIFLLWYIEFNVIWTPRNVIINEMIELAKRYWDEWSYRLINGIAQKIII